MLYAVLCYDDEDMVFARDASANDALMARLDAVQAPHARAGRLGPVARLMPTTSAVSVRKGAEPLVIDGPFAETKEQLLGFYTIECDGLDEAVAFAKELIAANPGAGGYEIRPLLLFRPDGALPA
jgi:hypothetical protein